MQVGWELREAAAPKTRIRPEVRIPELDGVRGLAILLVMLHHFVTTFPEAPHLLRTCLYLGWSGVDLFFVLSGFLIGGILFDTKGARNYFSSFYVRRILRIFPVYLLSVFVYFHAMPILARWLGHGGFSPGSFELWFWLHLSNWKSAFAPAPLTQYWSLSVEEQFYLIWPLVIYFVSRRKLPYVCFGVMMASFGLRCYFGQAAFGASWERPFLYRLTPFRLEPLALGSLLALAVRNPEVSARTRKYAPAVISVAALTILGTLLAGQTGQPFRPPMATFGLSAFSLLYGGLVLFAYESSGSGNWLSSFLRAPALQSFGKYSYAIYIVHFSIFVFFNRWLAGVYGAASGAWGYVLILASLLAATATSYLVALGSWHLIEKRFLALKGRFTAG